MTMTTTQSWAGLPDSIKRQAAPDMLAGKGWYHFGRMIEHPGADELRRWAGLAPQSPQAGATVAGSIRTAEAGVSAEIRTHARTAPENPAPLDQPGARQRAHSANPRPRKPVTRQEKREAVDLALPTNADTPDRELARLLGVSHTFIAMRRRKAGNVASASKGLNV